VYVCVVNALYKEGLLSFLMHVKLKVDGQSTNVHKVVPLTAQLLIDGHQEQALDDDSRQDPQDEAESAVKEENMDITESEVKNTNVFKDVDEYILLKEKRGKDKKARQKHKVIANDLWDTSGNQDAQIPAVLPDFMPFGLEGLEEEGAESEEEQQV
jgi:hypothetical protein